MKFFKFLIPLLISSMLLTGCGNGNNSNSKVEEDQPIKKCCYSGDGSIDTFVIGYQSEKRIFESESDVSITVFLGPNNDYETVIADGYHLKETDVYMRRRGALKRHKVLSINEDITSEKYELHVTSEEKFPKEFIGYTIKIPEDLFRETAGTIEITAEGKNYAVVDKVDKKDIWFSVDLNYVKGANGEIQLLDKKVATYDLGISQNDFNTLISREEIGISSNQPRNSFVDKIFFRDKLISEKQVFDLNNVTLQLYHGFTDCGIERYEEHKGTEFEGLDPIFINARLTCYSKSIQITKPDRDDSSMWDPSAPPIEYHIADIADVYSSEEFYYYDALKKEPLTFTVPAERFEHEVGSFTVRIYVDEFYSDDEYPPSEKCVAGVTFYYMKSGDKIFITGDYLDLKP